MTERPCAECGSPLPPQRTGRPRKYCESCRPARAEGVDRRRPPGGPWPCSCCQRHLPPQSFAKDASKGSGRKSLCRDCDNAKAKRYYVQRIGGYRNRSHDEVAAEREYLDALRHDPCAYCGSPQGGVLDHIEPVRTGGRDHWENLTGVCESCNCSKHVLPALFFMGRRQIDQEILPLLRQRAGWIGGDARGKPRRWLARHGWGGTPVTQEVPPPFTRAVPLREEKSVLGKLDLGLAPHRRARP